MSQHEVTLLLGSNLGDTKSNIELALSRLENEIGTIIKKSEILITDPVEFVSNNIFCNIAVIIKTQISPLQLLDRIKLIEREMGRMNDTKVLGAYQDRLIDIDIVCFGNLRFWCRELEIPHEKHLYHREFSRILIDELSTH